MYWHNLPINIKLIYILLGGFIMEKVNKTKQVIKNEEALNEAVENKAPEN